MKKSTKTLVALFALASLGLNACKKEELPPIGGFNSADEVAATNLIAYWNFEGNGTEKKNSLNPTKTVGASYTTGVKGMALSLTNGYLVYPEITAIAGAIQSASVSSWVQVKNNGSTATCFFTLTRPNEWAGNFNVIAETGWKKAENDSLTVKGLLVTKKDGADSWQDSRNDIGIGGVQANKVAGTNFFHLVVTYDAASSLFKVYVNGVKVSNPAWELRGNGTLGNLVFTTPTKPIIGTWGTVADGTSTDTWQAPMTGKIDELRVYTKALTEAEINSLYQLEKAGR